MAIHINKIRATNLHLTDAISTYVEKRVRALEKFIDSEDTSAIMDVEVGKTTKHHQRGDVFRAEFNFSFGGKSFRAVADEEDLYAAIDEVKDEMAREVRSSRSKEKTLFKKGKAAIKDLLKGFKK